MKENFLCEEIRNNFFVDKSRKMLWKIELDILQEVIRICEKYNISYFLHSGSALGAVRHKGFIPWDDDIDIGMLRDDFEKFIIVSHKEIKAPLFVQYGMNDGGHICGLLRVRNTETTGIIKIDKDKNCNNGVFIEIYPFDNVPNNKWKRKLQCFISKIFYHGLLACYYGPMSKRQALAKLLIKLIGIEKSYNIWQRICKKYNSKNCIYVDTVTLPDYAQRGICRFKLEWVRHLYSTKFEYITVKNPTGIHNILKLMYGDYMKFPPIEERGILHKKTVFYDPFTPYSYYIGSEVVNNYFSQ